jgi:predicted Zn-dependent peptidase
MKAQYLATAGFEFLESYIDNLSDVTPDDVNGIVEEYFSKPEYVACALASK